MGRTAPLPIRSFSDADAARTRCVTFSENIEELNIMTPATCALKRRTINKYVPVIRHRACPN